MSVEEEVVKLKQIAAEITTGSSALSKDLAIKAYPSNSYYGRVVNYLVPLKRCIDIISADGNCLFRAVAKEILGTDRYHHNLRSLVVEFMAKNPKLFSTIIGNYCSESLEQHIYRMKVDGVWGGAVELQAISSIYQVIIKVLSNIKKAPHWRWNHYIPHAPESFEDPSYPAIFVGKSPSQYSIELYYHNNCHFNRISSSIPDTTSASLPNIPMNDVALLSNSKEECIHL